MIPFWMILCNWFPYSFSELVHSREKYREYVGLLWQVSIVKPQSFVSLHPLVFSDSDIIPRVPLWKSHYDFL